MTGCLGWLIILAFAVFAMVSMIRWFEQITEAVDYGWWNKVIVLLVIPPIVWMYESKVSAGRPSAVPRHEPVQGFGIVPSSRGEAPKPPPPKRKRAAIDPAMIAKLKQKMKEQGMLKEDDSDD